MKFCATFKTPDAATYETFLERAELEVMLKNPDGVIKDRHGESDHIDPERDDLVDQYNDIAHNMADFARWWVGQGEYITVEFDTEAGTCTVVPNVR